MRFEWPDGWQCADSLGKAPDQTIVVLRDGYPTAHVVRQKEEHTVREQKFAGQGPIAAEIAVARRRKKFKR